MVARLIPPGEVFGQLTVVRLYGLRTKTRKLQYVCDCACGRKGVVKVGDSMKRGLTKSCGCGQNACGPRGAYNTSTSGSNPRHHSPAVVRRLNRDYADEFYGIDDVLGKL